MSVWKQKRNQKEHEIDVKELENRLRIISKQGNIEVMRLAVQSLIDELGDKYNDV